jgi:toxin CcdB
MSRFDLYRGAGYSDYLLDVQSDYTDFLDSRVVIPVVSPEKMTEINPRLHVILDIHGQRYHLVTNMMGAVIARSLGRPVTNLADQSHDVITAIDFLLQGF